ncbi:riboflavin kinase/FMN adenylyltransferase [Leucobacter exalbidus]|uniref:Riboflavin biosynthesis protein n=1 Tax=Leucobacter exalbidus TaxID=662960 RepID=A0A940T1S0_9MICO|nr:bifunctional riboflavin kinase/FAD synthetase [Leucobacter exalbidus]MBP1327135.1 riboflavin kinase/FMN adenylyltransferase [Leucobacter exalbidus]
MLVFESLDALDPAVFATGSCVAVGKFDGLHRGHQAILQQLERAATCDAEQGERSRTVVLTFANNPLSYLNPAHCPHPLMSKAQRLAAFADAGVDVCVMLEFDEKLASIPAHDFVADVLVEKLRARHIVMGADFRFGHRGAGDGALLEQLGAELGFRAELVEWVEDNEGEQMSSSRVREALAVGDVEAAQRMLGRAAVVRGEVVHGDARGRELGFPTANLGGNLEGFVPADGVYSGWVVIDGVRREAAISVGNNPTFTPNEQSRVEAFILDFEGDLYGQAMEVHFAHRLRGMVKFESLVALIDQMHDDVARARVLLAGD